ncbi:unnamed protein product [Rotaria sp. Silwood2]|nr:unnamed protein product [Rotaria sp. Silwood2]CAF2879551.1 unnamed protein product [Rotaria sp. Silwood2]CAF4033148.1 unnamed protein product [Rotaria sp. Silwood2]CAF4339523.1 unnamed protein product [Rotaria sp. Silwood2]
MKDIERVDLPDELILAIMKKVNPQVLFLCSMINISNYRLEQLAFDRCHSIDLTFDYFGAPHKLLMKIFYSDVMPHIIHNIKSLTINLYHISSIQTFVENNCYGTLPNLTHLKIMLGAKHSQTGIPYTIGNFQMFSSENRKPLFAIMPQFVVLPNCTLGENVATLCRSSLMHSIQSFEFDENLILTIRFTNGELYFDQLSRVTHLCISLWGFHQCVHLLNQLGSQLHSFTVTIAKVLKNQLNLISQIRSISCPRLKQMTMIMYHNFNNYEPCIFLLQCLSNVEYLKLLLAIGQDGITPNHFIDGSILERDILSYMPRLRQFNYHIRSILKNAFHIKIDQIRQSFLKQQEPFDCVLDHFKNKYGQCQIYSLPFIGTRLDFISNRFPLFDINNTFSNVTILLLFDDVKPFETIFFERLTRALPRLRTLEIINQLEQQEKSISVMKTNIDFSHLAVLILYDIHIDYAEQLICQIHLPSLIELAINKDILFTIISQNQLQARDNCSRVGTLRTSKPSYESICTIQNFFPLAYYVKHEKE